MTAKVQRAALELFDSRAEGLLITVNICGGTGCLQGVFDRELRGLPGISCFFVISIGMSHVYI